MRFMSIVTSAHNGMATPELMEAMGKLADREIKAGRMIDMGGLMPLADGVQVRIKDGELSVIDGPFVEAKEVIGGFAIFEFRNKEEALASAVEFMQLHKQHMPGWEGTCASSLLRNSKIAKPPITSLASTKGPSITLSSPSLMRTCTPVGEWHQSTHVDHSAGFDGKIANFAHRLHQFRRRHPIVGGSDDRHETHGESSL